MTTQAKAIWTALLVTASLLTVALVVIVLSGLERPESKADKLLNYLDHHGVVYSSERDMLALADVLCDMRTDGIETESFLRITFSQEDTNYIQWGVFNGGYCEQ